MGCSVRAGLMLVLTLAGWGVIGEVAFQLLPPMGALLAGVFAGGFWLAGVIGLFFRVPSPEEVEGEEL